VSDYLDAKLRGIRCHVTQVGHQNLFSETPDEVTRETWFRKESFILAHSTVGRPQGLETDLFAGLR
jgi:LmbE family N-acetylglucosaminyl deacetylase